MQDKMNYNNLELCHKNNMLELQNGPFLLSLWILRLTTVIISIKSTSGISILHMKSQKFMVSIYCSSQNSSSSQMSFNENSFYVYIQTSGYFTLSEEAT